MTMRIAGNRALAISWTIFGITTPFLLLRVYLRCRTRNIRWFSEIAVVLAYLFYLGSNVCDTEIWKRGLFRPDANYDRHWQRDWPVIIHNDRILREIMKIKYAGVFLFYSQIWAVKFAILTFLYRVSPQGLINLRRMLHCVGAIVAFSYTVVLLEMLFYCSPISQNWSFAQGSCHAFVDIAPYTTAFGLHLITNLALFILPFFILHYYDIDTRHKTYQVSILFAVGLFYMLSILGRLAILFVSVNVSIVALWASVEQAAGVVLVCFLGMGALTWEERTRAQSQNTPIVRAFVEDLEVFFRRNKHPKALVSSDVHQSPKHLSRASLMLDGKDEMRDWIRMSSPTPQIIKVAESPTELNNTKDCLSPLRSVRTKNHHHKLSDCNALNESLKRSGSMNESVEILRNDIMRSITLQAYPHGVPLGQSL